MGGERVKKEGGFLQCDHTGEREAKLKKTGLNFKKKSGFNSQKLREEGKNAIL